MTITQELNYHTNTVVVRKDIKQIQMDTALQANTHFSCSRLIKNIIEYHLVRTERLRFYFAC